MGRFLNADDVAVVTATPETAHWNKNLYAYCDNNPTMRVDGTGEAWSLAGIVIGVGVGAITSFASTLITGGTMEDALISAGIGAVAGGVASLGGVYHVIAGLASGVITTLMCLDEGSSIKTALLAGTVTGITSTLTIGYGASKLAQDLGIGAIEIGLNTVMDVTFGFGGNLSSSAITNGMVKNDVDSNLTKSKSITTTAPAVKSQQMSYRPYTYSSKYGVFQYRSTNAYTIRM